MIKNKDAESLVGIIIAVFILSFTILGILNILGFSQSLEGNYRNTVFTDMVQSNAENIVRKIKLPHLENNEYFYIKKDTINKTFLVLTGTTNEQYKYINFIGENVDSNTNQGVTYIRTYQFKKDILRHKIEPNEISNLIFWYDSTNINGNNNTGINDNDSINEIIDLSGNGNKAYQNSSSAKPTFKKETINNNDSIFFDGNNDRLLIDDNVLINTDNDSSTSTEYKEKSFAFVIKTGDDVTSDQIIFEQGGTDKGYNFMIHDGDLHIGVWNTDEWDSWNQYKTLNLGEALPYTTYFITIIQDSSNNTDENNLLKLYINGILVNSIDHVDLQTEQENNIGIGALTDGTVFPWSPYNSDSGDDKYHFKGYLGELIGWNHILSKIEIKGIQNYFEEKWNNKIDNVKYNLIKTNVSMLK